MLTLADVDQTLWSRFQSEADPRLDGAEPLTFARWRRARRLGARVDGTRGEEHVVAPSALQERERRLAGVILRAHEVLPGVLNELHRRGYAAALADEDGVVLCSWGGELFDPRVASAFRAGALWDEGTRGTNAIGTALAEHTAVSVLGAAHYMPWGHALACYAAPIRDADGRLIAVLDVTGPVGNADVLVGALVEALAARLEQPPRGHAGAGPSVELLATVAHELRNPLSSIRLSASVLERMLAGRHGDARELRSVRAILASAQRTNRMVDDLLQASTLETGRLRLALAPLPAAALLEDATEMARTAASTLKLHIHRDAALPPVLADRDRILQVFSNLVTNAAKFTPAGGELHLCARATADWVRFGVQDSGPGIAPEDLPSVFERAWKADPRDPRGAGLGLFISKRLVEDHGGVLTVESWLGQGTCFMFTLSAAR